MFRLRVNFAVAGCQFKAGSARPAVHFHELSNTQRARHPQYLLPELSECLPAGLQLHTPCNSAQGSCGHNNLQFRSGRLVADVVAKFSKL